MQQPLFLTGMMGCGKTEVGRALALAHGVPLIDLDERLERIFGVTVAEVFASGEPAFREHEAQVLRSLLAEPGMGGRGVVVATGGGAVLDPRNRAAMDAVGPRLYLEVGVDELVRRLRPPVHADPGARPLLGDDASQLRGRVAELLAARGSVYRGGARCIDAQADPETVVTRINQALATLVPPAGARDSEAV